jgi:hypothetical protein
MCIRALIFDTTTTQVPTKSAVVASYTAPNPDLCLLARRVLSVFGLVISAALTVTTRHPLALVSTLFFAICVVNTFFCEGDSSDDDSRPGRSPAERINVTIVNPSHQTPILPIQMSANSSLASVRPVLIQAGPHLPDPTARAPLGSRDMLPPPPRPPLVSRTMQLPPAPLRIDVTERAQLGSRSEDHAAISLVSSPVLLTSSTPQLSARPAPILAAAFTHPAIDVTQRAQLGSRSADGSSSSSVLATSPVPHISARPTPFLAASLTSQAVDVTQRAALGSRERPSSPPSGSLFAPTQFSSVPQTAPRHAVVAQSATAFVPVYPTIAPRVDVTARAQLGSRSQTQAALSVATVPAVHSATARAKLGERAPA